MLSPPILKVTFQSCLEKDRRECVSVKGDCKHITGACPTEQCQPAGKKYSQCVCPEGSVGNGIQCYSNGTVLADPNTQISLDITLQSEELKFPFDGDDFSHSAQLASLITEMGNVESSCSGDQCEATFNQNEA